MLRGIASDCGDVRGAVDGWLREQPRPSATTWVTRQLRSIAPVSVDKMTSVCLLCPCCWIDDVRGQPGFGRRPTKSLRGLFHVTNIYKAIPTRVKLEQRLPGGMISPPFKPKLVVTSLPAWIRCTSQNHALRATSIIFSGSMERCQPMGALRITN